ncbi:hypothetical protein FOL47_005324, partial [Perkinsus chesapeaki]
AAISAQERLSPRELIEARSQVMNFWEERREQLASATAASASRMPEAVRAVAGKLNLPLFKEMLVASAYPDDSLADELQNGLPLTGSFEVPLAVFRKNQGKENKRRVIALEELLESGPELAKKMARQLESNPSEWDDTLWKSAIDETESRTMIGPLPLEDLEALFEDGFVASPRFAVVQTDKIRPCDDFKRSN